jgi:hypothetical protein
MALIVILLLGYLFNENSALCLFKAGLPGSACKEGFVGMDTGPAHNGKMDSVSFSMQPGLTPEENDILQKLLAKQARFNASVTKADESPHTDEPIASLDEIYEENLEKVKSLFN